MSTKRPLACRRIGDAGDKGVSTKRGTSARSILTNKKVMYPTTIIAAAVVITILAITLWPKPAWMPSINGTLGSGEWDSAQYSRIPFWLDVNNTVDPTTGTRNVDAWNYLYVGSDTSNYYFGLDLVSDQTNNVDGEWLDIYLANQMPQIEASEFGFHAMRDHGFEFINYNTSTDASMPRMIDYGSATNDYSIPFVPGVDSYTVRYGTTSSSYKDFWREDGSNFTVHSEVVPNSEMDASAGGYDNTNLVVINFVFDIESKFPKGYADNFLAGVNLTHLYLETSMTATFDADGSWAEPDPDTILAVAVTDDDSAMFDSSSFNDVSGTGIYAFDDGYFYSFPANENTADRFDNTAPISMAVNNKWYFSLVFWNENGTDTDFTVMIDKLCIGVRTSGIDAYSDTSIATANYNVEFSYGASDNSAVPHRMYEIRVAKSEFPTNGDGNLYVYFAGYGTMAMSGIDLWFYPYSLYSFVSLLSGSEFPLYDGMFSQFASL